MANGSGERRTVLFTAFEPSGDAHAAGVIAALARTAPDLDIVALGGRLMEQAGARLLDRTADEGAMGLSSLSRIRAVRAARAAVLDWSASHRVSVHVPVDSPAANWAIAESLRGRGSRVVHLVAPQLWAWGEGRIERLRKCTDLVLCLLPFEEEWFRKRQVPARFIGHPSFERPADEAAWKAAAANFPRGSPRILLLPGSRGSEIRANSRLLVQAFSELAGRFRGTSGVIACRDEEAADRVRHRVREMPTGLHLCVCDIDAAAHWATVALAVSGTVTLDLTRHAVPMVGVYRTGLLSLLGARLFIKAPLRLLPNVLAGREVVPEFVPCLAKVEPIVEAAAAYVSDTREAARASASLRALGAEFEGHHPSVEAAEAITSFARHGRAEG